MSTNVGVILVHCSARKRPGGQARFLSPSWLRHRLSPASMERLLAARKELATFINEAPGPDLGFSQADTDIQFLPAWQRYDGNMYRTAEFRDVWPRRREKPVLIVSALYGLVLADDLIRDYELSMDCHGADGSRLYTWWKRHGLGGIVAECVHSYRPAIIHDLLSGKYRKALGPWPESDLVGIVMQHNFPRVGIGAGYARGRQLRELLEDP